MDTSPDDPVFSLTEFPVHLGLGATAVPLERFTGDMDWYTRYGERTTADGADGRLVTLHTFAEPWSTWEVHPNGAELVLCTDGRITLLQQVDDGERSVVLHAGEAVVNPPGVWHTADVEQSCTCLFITAGLGTENRAR